MVSGLEKRRGDGGIDGGGYGHHAARGVHGAGGDGLEAAGLQGEAKVHRLDGVADRARAGKVEHVAAGDQVHGAAAREVFEAAGVDVVDLSGSSFDDALAKAKAALVTT